jgi:hypothetical protein
MNSHLDQLNHQRDLLLEWLKSADARRFCEATARRHRLNLKADELISEAWLRITRSFDARTEPLPAMSTIEAATRYGARIIDNLCRDIARRNLRNRETSLEVVMAGTGNVPAITVSPIENADNRILLEQVLIILGRNIEKGFNCPGCPNYVVAATATEIIHMVLVGEDGASQGRTWLDQLLYAALEKVDPQPAQRSDSARTQRKSRCGRCVRELLTSALTTTLGGSQ